MQDGSDEDPTTPTDAPDAWVDEADEQAWTDPVPEDDAAPADAEPEPADDADVDLVEPDEIDAEAEAAEVVPEADAMEPGADEGDVADEVDVPTEPEDAEALTDAPVEADEPDPVAEADHEDDADQAGDLDEVDEVDVVAEPVAEGPSYEPTGHAGVDRVLAGLEGLEERSVHEHVAVFEEAHGALRRALDHVDQD